MVAPDGLYDGTGDILPDLFSGNAVFNAGDYHSVGYTACGDAEPGRQLQRDPDVRLRWAR